MVPNNEEKCPDCGGRLKYYDKVSRILRTKGRSTTYVQIRRLRCVDCGKVHREIPDYILPYKQYEAEIVNGVVAGLITCETFGYEDYPCEMTMQRWRSQNLQYLL